MMKKMFIVLGLIAIASAVQAQKLNDLKAHDINGYALDMTVDQVQQVAKQSLENKGQGQYKLTIDGINYDFEFTVLGHLWRIESNQVLGRFIPDHDFAQVMSKKLSDKYGSTTASLTHGPMNWNFEETYFDGALRLERVALSLDVLLTGGYGEPIGLDMTLMDARIERRDIAKANADPKSKAESSVKF